MVSFIHLSLLSKLLHTLTVLVPFPEPLLNISGRVASVSPQKGSGLNKNAPKLLFERGG